VDSWPQEDFLVPRASLTSHLKFLIHAVLQPLQTIQISDRATRIISLHKCLKPIQCASDDEVAVQELWHRVREFCDTQDFPMALSLPSSAQPAGLSRKPLSKYKEENSITIRLSARGTQPPEPHFISLGYQPLPLQSADRLRMDKTREDYEHFTRTQDLNSANGCKIIEEVFFPHRLADPYFKYLNAAISIGEISLEKQTTPLAQQHVKVETKSRAQSSATALRASTRRPKPSPPISRHIASQSSARARNSLQLHYTPVAQGFRMNFLSDSSAHDILAAPSCVSRFLGVHARRS
jgi:hypothetical protein